MMARMTRGNRSSRTIILWASATEGSRVSDASTSLKEMETLPIERAASDTHTSPAKRRADTKTVRRSVRGEPTFLRTVGHLWLPTAFHIAATIFAIPAPDTAEIGKTAVFPSFSLLRVLIWEGFKRVNLRERDDAGFSCQILAEQHQFLVEHRIVGLRILTRAIKQENENVGPFDMAQELYAQSFSFMRPLDEARDVGHHKALPHVDAHNPQVGTRVVNG